MTLPKHVSTRPTPSAGTGLFTIRSIDAGDLMFKVERPQITTLDSARLFEYCEWCLVNGREVEDEAGSVRLRACTGCKIVRYCSKVSS